MPPSIRCRLLGHGRDACGVCSRCGDEAGAAHDWKESERARPCYRLETCDRCGAQRENPDHDWEPGAAGGGGDISLKCARCGLKI